MPTGCYDTLPLYELPDWINMRISIAGKICFVLLLLFSGVLLGTTTYQTKREQQSVLALADAKARMVMQDYLLGINQPAAIAASLPHFQQNGVQIRFIAHDNPTQATTQNEKQDAEVITHQAREILRLTLPVYAIPMPGHSSYFTLHSSSTAVFVGMLELQTDITSSMAKVEEDIFWMALILCFCFGAALLLALTIIRQQIVSPLQSLQHALERATDLGDFTTRLPLERHDEISQLNDSFNQLMITLDKSSHLRN